MIVKAPHIANRHIQSVETKIKNTTEILKGTKDQKIIDKIKWDIYKKEFVYSFTKKYTDDSLIPKGTLIITTDTSTITINEYPFSTITKILENRE